MLILFENRPTIFNLFNKPYCVSNGLVNSSFILVYVQPSCYFDFIQLGSLVVGCLLKKN